MFIYIFPVFLRVCSLVFAEILHSDINLETEKGDGKDFPEKFFISLKTQKVLKMGPK